MSRSTHLIPIVALHIVVNGLGLASEAEAQNIPQPQHSSGGISGININRDARQEARRALEAQIGRQSSNANGSSSNGLAGTDQSAFENSLTPQRATSQGPTGSTTGNPAIASTRPLFQNRPGTAGLQATELAVAGPFGLSGLRSGDYLLSINGQPLQSEAQLLQVLRSMGTSNQPANVVISRGGAQETITVQPTAVMQAVNALATNSPALPGIHSGTATTVNRGNLSNQVGSSPLNSNPAVPGSALAPIAGVPTGAGGVTTNGATTTSSSSPSPALGPTASVNGNTAAPAPASPSQPSLTSGIVRGPSVVGPSSSIQGVGANVQNSATTPSAAPGVVTSGAIAATGGTTTTGVTPSTGTPALGPTSSTITNSTEAMTLATPNTPSTTSGIVRGPSVTGPSSSIQGVGADLQNAAITPSATAGVNTSGSLTTTGGTTATGTVTTGAAGTTAGASGAAVNGGAAVPLGAAATGSTATPGQSSGATGSAQGQGGMGPGVQSFQLPAGASPLAPGIGQQLPGTTANPATLVNPNPGSGNATSGNSGTAFGAGINPIQGLGTGTPSSQGTINSSIPGGYSGVPNSGQPGGGPGNGAGAGQGKGGMRGGATQGGGAAPGTGAGGAAGDSGAGGEGSGGGAGRGGGGAGAGGT